MYAYGLLRGLDLLFVGIAQILFVFLFFNDVDKYSIYIDYQVPSLKAHWSINYPVVLNPFNILLLPVSSS